MSQTANGLLPLAPLRHPDPTAIGEIELAEGVTARRPDPAGLAGCRDEVLLVRLHGAPLGFLHVAAAPQSVQPRAIAEAVWSQMREPLRDHLQRYGCGAEPAGPDDLLRGLGSPEHGCPAARPARPPGRAAIVVATVGRPEPLRRALRSLGELVDDDHEVIVVDNRPGEGVTQALVAELAGRQALRYVAEPRQGLAIARNAGLGAAVASGAAYIAFTDDDVVVDPGWLTWLLSPFADERVASVTGLVVPLNLATEATKRFERYAGFGKGVEPEVYDLVEHRADDRLLYPYWGGMFGSGNSMAFRCRSLRGIGGFDPALGAGTPTGGGEDIAAFSDVILAGERLVYEPRSVCWHEHRADARGLEAQVHSYGVGFTATLWRYLLRDPRFLAAAARSLMIVVRVQARRRREVSGESLPGDLLARERRGWLIGPWRYERSRRRARRVRDRP